MRAVSAGTVKSRQSSRRNTPTPDAAVRWHSRPVDETSALPGPKKCPSAGNGGRTGNYKTLGGQLFGSLVFGRFFGFGRFRLGGRFRDGGGSE